MNMEKLVNEVEELNNNAPVDADTILVDVMRNDTSDWTGVAQDIFNIWKESTNRKSVEQMFFEFTGMTFETYLMKCKKEITK